MEIFIYISNKWKI